MQIILTMLMILSTICLSSCKDPDSYPRIEDQEQLSIFLAKPVKINNQLYIPVDKSACFRRTYTYQKHFIGPIDSSEPMDVYYCQKMIGKSPKQYTIFFQWLDDFRIWLNDQV